MAFPSLKNQKPILVACQILGILPYNTILGTSKFHKIYSLVMSMFTLCFLFYFKMTLSTWDVVISKGNLIVGLMMIIKEFIDLIIIFTHIGSLVFRRNEIQKFIMGIKFLELGNANGNARSKPFHIIFILIIIVIGQIAYNMIHPFNLHSMLECVAIQCPYFSSYFIGISYSIFIEYLRIYLDHMVKFLKPNEKTILLKVDLTVYILDLCRYVNHFYSMQIFTICFRVLISLILFGHLSISSLGPNSAFNDPVSGILEATCFIVFNLVKVAEEVCLLVSICRSCTKIQKTVDLFNNKLFNLMREHKDLCSNDKLQLYVAMKQTVNFTACGCFSVGYPSVTSIITAATTYLVILVQFNSPA